jgi:hypothetical protein
MQSTLFETVKFQTLGLKLLELFIGSNFKISIPQCPAHYTPDGTDDVLDIVVHQKVQLSEVTVTDILDSDHLPELIMFSILDPVTMRETSDSVEKLTDWELFQSLASELKSPNIEIHSSHEADKAASDFAAPMAID